MKKTFKIVAILAVLKLRFLGGSKTDLKCECDVRLFKFVLKYYNIWAGSPKTKVFNQYNSLLTTITEVTLSIDLPR